ncbi:MAG: PAS domain S-box protein [Bacteroidota bacterium]
MDISVRKIKILHLEDLPTDAELVERALKQAALPFEKIVVDNKADFENALETFSPDIVLSDHSLPSFNSIEALHIVKEKQLHIPFILITAAMTDEFAVEIMREGADDYIIKDRLHRVPTAVLNCLEKFRLEKEKQIFLDKIVQNEIRFRALIEKSTDMKMLSTIDGIFIYGSPSVEKTFGYTSKEFLLKPAAEFFHPDDIKEFLSRRAVIVKQPGESIEFEYRLRHKRGHWLWCEGTLTNFLYEPGINAFVSNFRDISGKKEAEEIREFDKNNLNALINNTRDLMWSVDTSFNLITSNKPFNEMAKQNFGKVIEKGENVLDTAQTPEMKANFMQLYKRAFTGESFTRIERFDFPVRFWAEISYHPIVNNGIIVGTACQSRDITERKKTEHLLKKSEAFNRGVLNSLSSHIAVLDFHGNIIAVNDSWNRFALENGSNLAGSGVGSNYFDVCERAISSNAELAEEAYKGIKDVMDETIKDFYLEYPCHSNDEQRWYGMRVIKFDGKEPMIVVSHHNISERKKAEQEVIEKNLQLKNLLHIAQTIREEERTNVAREIHDELGQQLTALKMDIDWILHKQTNPDTKVVGKLNDMLKMNDGIINTVRRISSDLRPAIIDDIGLVATIEWKCTDFETKTGIPCSFISDVTERKYSKDFSIHLYRILQETLTNISRHAEASLVNISLTENDRRELILDIQDNGKGITLENLSNRKRLGILGMKERAGLLKGELTITGDENKGTHVKLILSLENERTDSR